MPAPEFESVDVGTYQSELLDNYEQLRKDRDWSPEVMASNIETSDPAMAAEYRSRFTKAEAAPKARKSAASKSEA